VGLRHLGSDGPQRRIGDGREKTYGDDNKEAISMSIRTFAHKGAEEVFLTGRSRRIGAEFHRRVSLILDAIDAATGIKDLVGARGFHALQGSRCNGGQRQLAGDLPLRTPHHGDVLDVDFEDYH
jgi:plasmid maintenance system killer protein